MQGGDDDWRHSKDQGGQAIPVVVPIAVPVASAAPIAPSVALRLAQRVCGVALTTSMRRLFEESKAQFARRWILVDNSGSMAMHDGNRINPTTGRSVACTRWEELTASLAFHGEMAELLQARKDLNLSATFGHDVSVKVADAMQALIAARTAMVDAHAQLDESRLRLGLRTRMVGDIKPEDAGPTGLREAI